MMDIKEIIKGSFNDTGIIEIDVPLVISKWSLLWGVYQWGDTYRLIKSVRRDSELTDLKITISKEQAQELIMNIPLIGLPSPFRSATTWKREKDIVELEY